MELRIILGLFVMSNVLLIVGADYGGKIVTKSRSDSNDVEEYPENGSKNRKLKLGLDDLRPGSKITEMLSQTDFQPIEKLTKLERSDPLEEGNRKILRFGKRVFQSIKKHGVMAKDVPLLNSGNYRIDWWKKNRRLQGMRKRLAEEFEKNPKLKLRLQSLGWRNNSADINHDEKIDTDHPDEENSAMSLNGDVKIRILYKMFVVDFNSGESAADSPTKFSLNTHEKSDFGATTSDFNIIEVTSGEVTISSEDEASSTSDERDLDDRVVDGDRFLQIIPLVVEELREGLMSEEERRAFRGIFGKRLWQLLEREASKKSVQPMDYELAKFLFTGQLPDRQSENARRGRNQKPNLPDHKKRKNRKHDRQENRQRDHDCGKK